MTKNLLGHAEEILQDYVQQQCHLMGFLQRANKVTRSQLQVWPATSSPEQTDVGSTRLD